ncbi:hypothetical protein AcW1_008582 [Taiwanofungus camphoratus]|nr:hypothetical protein AcW1_008582 [Antrodia cinnamomea]
MASIKVNASDHPVAAVTVFRSSTAEVVRPFLVDLKQGQNRIEIAGLPDRIDAKSARISDLGGLAYPLAVTCTVDRSDPVSSVQPTQTVRQLVLKKQAI